jgi:hypothetical protein
MAPGDTTVGSRPTPSGRTRALVRERRTKPTSPSRRQWRQPHEFRRVCRLVSLVGLRPPCATSRQTHVTQPTGRRSTYRRRNAVATKPATSLCFLRRLIKSAGRKVFFIVDNLRVHRAKSVTAWVEANRDWIEVGYLPPYAPDRNPDEFMHNDLKQGLARRRTPKNRAGLKSSLQSHMRKLQRRPAKVRAFFQAPTVRYAA